MFEKRARSFVGIGVLILALGGVTSAGGQGGGDANSVPYSFGDLGGFHLHASGDDSEPIVFYGEVEPTGGTSLPSGFGIFSFRDPGGRLLTETSVPVQNTLTDGRLFASYFSDGTNTGLAVVNPNDQEVTIDFRFENPLLQEPQIGTGTIVVPPGGQFSRFLSEAPFDLPDGTTASMTFSASLPVAAITLLETKNAAGDTLYNTLPVVDLGVEPADRAVYMPHFATGGLWSTEFILINPTDEEIKGALILISGGSIHPENPDWDVPGQTFESSLTDTFFPTLSHPYTIGPGGVLVWSTVSTSFLVSTGSARAIPVSGSRTPVVQVVFNYLGAVENENGQIVSDRLSRAAYSSGGGEGTAFRMYVESRGELDAPGSVTSGVAVNSTNFDPIDQYQSPEILFEIRTFDGTFSASTVERVPSSGQRAWFIDQLFPDVVLPEPLRGTLTVTVLSPGRTIAVTGLRARRSEEDRFMVTTTPPTAVDSIAPPGPGYMPQLVNGGGWETEAVLFSGTAGQAATGQLRFFGPGGEPHVLPSDE